MKKGQLPTKICPVCNRPFEWRKKWRNCWQEVVYCSEKCRRNKTPSVHDDLANRNGGLS
ncbi:MULTISPECIES: DUF2256 domain-containing protein [Roseivirga]|uniref:DUF2256 domain-containing protein n=1 Tax=Roseivirga TaxID=290180 RepID=UPI0009FBCC1E|nr:MULTISPECIES: DUF2256 domain-containing protein [Roseivirga]MBO6494711.1 DUF2256 domain-containing protein [Roseivirga sp.]MBO6662381.1 DUF2256 domain-containing protein [Roseivirga sp.]MBO6762070.1 DUF2256 domain-containing protein [Roseivirga sp.]MBO6910325.1 DUF2256 domain-containing protein [Roseivirga sp.]WPZ10819.1 DUF2256 domain-containing protein [Roseivirga spongicola]